MAARLIILICFIFILSNCSKNENEEIGCPNPKPELRCPLLDTANHWYEDISTKKTILAQSSKGRSESYDIGYKNGYESWGIENCHILFGETRFLEYSSSLYGHTFFFEIQRIGNIDYLTISPQRNYPTYSRVYVKLNLQQPDSCILTYLPTQNKFTTAQISIPVVKQDSIIVKNKTYFNIYKIAFTNTTHSFNGATKMLYFNGRNGLLQFETFDGEVWSLY